jgi:hypothetical protein
MRGRDSETIAATGNVKDIASACCATTKRLAQCGDVESETALIDIHIGPDLFDQFPFVHDLAGTLCKEDENVERATADMEWIPVLLQ